jgi:predicted MFS family arabinose efflux permease
MAALPLQFHLYGETAMPLPILALALSAFAIGTTEFVIMGILPDVAHSLSVSIPSAGLLVSGYALGVAIGAPLLAVLTSRMPRKWALLLLMGIFIAGNVLCAVAPGYTSLMIARVITSFAHGSFFGIGSVVAASLVPQDKRASRSAGAPRSGPWPVRACLLPSLSLRSCRKRMKRSRVDWLMKWACSSSPRYGSHS